MFTRFWPELIYVASGRGPGEVKPGLSRRARTYTGGASPPCLMCCLCFRAASVSPAGARPTFASEWNIVSVLQSVLMTLKSCSSLDCSNREQLVKNACLVLFQKKEGKREKKTDNKKKPCYYASSDSISHNDLCPPPHGRLRPCGESESSLFSPIRLTLTILKAWSLCLAQEPGGF